MKTLEIIALIYRSTQYLDFISKQLLSVKNNLYGFDISTRIVANNPTREVIEALKSCTHNYDIYLDPIPDDYYMNRVYRCWNYAGSSSKADIICFVNSDMAFSNNWLENLLKHHDGQNIVCSRLIESGKMPSGRHGVSMNFGKHPKSFKPDEWNEFAAKIAKDELHSGGLYMPVLFNTSRFIESGMYPEGNIYVGGIGAYTTPFLRSGDEYFFNDILGKKYGMKHVTAFNSVVYHIQEGEKDE
jgi:hypothetical protein